MHIIKITALAKNTTLALFSAALVGISCQALAISSDEASQQIKNQPCKNNLTVEQILDQSVKRYAQHDAGWHIFHEQDHYDVEREISLNKSTELRFRWRVSADGGITANNERTEHLCRG